MEGLKEVHLALDASKVLGGVQSQQPGGVVRDQLHATVVIAPKMHGANPTAV